MTDPSSSSGELSDDVVDPTSLTRFLTSLTRAQLLLFIGSKENLIPYLKADENDLAVWLPLLSYLHTLIEDLLTPVSIPSRKALVSDDGETGSHNRHNSLYTSSNPPLLLAIIKASSMVIKHCKINLNKYPSTELLPKLLCCCSIPIVDATLDIISKIPIDIVTNLIIDYMLLWALGSIGEKPAGTRLVDHWTYPLDQPLARPGDFEVT